MEILKNKKKKLIWIVVTLLVIILGIIFCLFKFYGNKKPKISVIVPIYNVEKYLPKCLDSLTAQTLKDIEIICINDGSPDNSLKILENYQSKDSRIKIINKENGGVSSARNTGIRAATGEYISFVDPDDYVGKNLYKYTYENVKKNNADALCFGCLDFNDGEEEPNEKNYPYKGDEVKVYKRLNEKQNPFETMHINESVIWNKLWKTSMLKDNDLYFKEDMRNGEDVLFVWFAIPKIKTFVWQEKDVFYYYRKMRKGSLMSSATKQKKVDQCIKGLGYLVENKDYFNFDGSDKWILSKLLDWGYNLITTWLDTPEEKKEFTTKLFNAVEEKFLDKIDRNIDPESIMKIESLKMLL